MFIVRILKIEYFALVRFSSQDSTQLLKADFRVKILWTQRLFDILVASFYFNSLWIDRFQISPPMTWQCSFVASRIWTTSQELQKASPVRLNLKMNFWCFQKHGFFWKLFRLRENWNRLWRLYKFLVMFDFFLKKWEGGITKKLEFTMFLTPGMHLFGKFFCIESVILVDKNVGKVEKNWSKKNYLRAELPKAHLAKTEKKDIFSEKNRCINSCTLVKRKNRRLKKSKLNGFHKFLLFSKTIFTSDFLSRDR